MLKVNKKDVNLAKSRLLIIETSASWSAVYLLRIWVVCENDGSDNLSFSHLGNSLPVLFGGKGIQSSYCKYLSLVTQNNNALCCTRKNLEENFIRAFIVLQILALWEN